jgi:hypothetical protein
MTPQMIYLHMRLACRHQLARPAYSIGFDKFIVARERPAGATPPTFVLQLPAVGPVPLHSTLLHRS